MSNMRLEYRLHKDDVGKGKINVGLFPSFRGIRLHNLVGHWNYFRHLPPDYELGKSESTRKKVLARLLENLNVAIQNGGKMDIGPLRDDVRVSGKVFGENPLHNMFLIISELARNDPSYPFFGKWGGNMLLEPGKGVIFYAANEADAESLISKLALIATAMNANLELRKKLGISAYRQFVEIDDAVDGAFMSSVTNPNKFKQELEDLQGYPHFFHELFTGNCTSVFIKPSWISYPA